MGPVRPYITENSLDWSSHCIKHLPYSGINQEMSCRGDNVNVSGINGGNLFAQENSNKECKCGTRKREQQSGKTE